MSIGIVNLSSRVTSQDLKRLVMGLRYLDISTSVGQKESTIVLSDDYSADFANPSSILNVATVLDNGPLLHGQYSLLSLLMKEIVSVSADPLCKTWIQSPKGMIANDPVAPLFGESEEKEDRHGHVVHLPATITATWYNGGEDSLEPFSYLSTGYQIKVNSLGIPELSLGVDLPDWVKGYITNSYRTKMRLSGASSVSIYSAEETSASMSETTILEEPLKPKKSRSSRFFRKLETNVR